MSGLCVEQVDQDVSGRDGGGVRVGGGAGDRGVVDLQGAAGRDGGDVGAARVDQLRLLGAPGEGGVQRQRARGADVGRDGAGDRLGDGGAVDLDGGGVGGGVGERDLDRVG